MYDPFTFPAARFMPQMQRIQALQQRLQGMNLPPQAMARLQALFGGMNRPQAPTYGPFNGGQLPGYTPNVTMPTRPQTQPMPGYSPGGVSAPLQMGQSVGLRGIPGMGGISQAANSVGRAMPQMPGFNLRRYG